MTHSRSLIHAANSRSPGSPSRRIIRPSAKRLDRPNWRATRTEQVFPPTSLAASRIARPCTERCGRAAVRQCSRRCAGIVTRDSPMCSLQHGTFRSGRHFARTPPLEESQVKPRKTAHSGIDRISPMPSLNILATQASWSLFLMDVATRSSKLGLWVAISVSTTGIWRLTYVCTKVAYRNSVISSSHRHIECLGYPGECL